MVGAGMPISDAFAQIEHQPNIYDVVHVKYFDEVCDGQPLFGVTRATKLTFTDWCGSFCDSRNC